MIAQELIINKILTTKNIDIVEENNLTDKYFSNYKAEFNFIKNHYNKYHCIPDKITFQTNFPQFCLVDCNESSEYLISQLQNENLEFFIAQSFNIVANYFNEGKPDKAREYYISSFQNIPDITPITAINLFEDTSRYDSFINKSHEKDKGRITTGLVELDKLLHGGIEKIEENMVISARTGQGKTQLLIKFAVAAAKAGYSVGIYEGEMSNDKLGYRVDTINENLTNSELNNGSSNIESRYKDYINSIKAYGYKLYILNSESVPNYSVTVDTLQAFIKKYKLDILFIDQYDLLDDKNKGKSYSEKTANIARDIKQLQQKEKIPIVSIAQMNRTKNEDGSLDTTQIAGSDSVSRFATTLLMVTQQRDENERRLISIELVKSRDGNDRKKVTYLVNFNTGVYNYIPEEDNEAAEELRQQYTPTEDKSNVF